MRNKVNKQVLEKINFLFQKAKKTKNNQLSKKYIILARQIAKRTNTRLPKNIRQIFCHKCDTLFRAKTVKIRIKHKKISIKCLNCGNYTRYKLDVKGGRK
jgi:ribonuclease P protein subunit RPR2